jgi:signal transduction histidine kinase
MATTAPRLGRVRELVDAVQQLSLARSVEEIRAVVRRAARELTGADGATFVLREGEFCHYVDEDAIEPLWKGQRFPLKICISGWAMLNRQPAVIEDIYADDRIPHDAYRPTFVKSLAMVPMRMASPVGAIGNYWASEHRASDEEVELLQALADSTAVAMENVRVYRELEQRVRDRTAELESANERLVELDALRTRFAHATTHELRSPLTSIIGFASILAGRLPEPEADYAGTIYKSATRLSALVDDLLTLAELEHSELPIQPERVVLADVISGSLHAFSAAAGAAQIELNGDAENGLSVHADPVRVAQVLDNLISNSIKYTPAGGHVEVHARADGEHVVVEVVDDGIGIGEEDKGRLFDPFFRTAAGREKAGGTGLGLRISREIAEAHDGELTVRDTPGGGSTFELRLPRR